MKVFISDIHMGDGSKADDFHRDKELIDFLNWTDGKAGEIIILGDLYELWQADLEDIYWAHPKVMNALHDRNNKITYLYGNHDYLPFSKLTPEVYKNGNITAMHGHQFDKHNNFKNPLFSLKWPIGKYITLVVAELERWITPDADVWLDKMRKRFGNFLVDAAHLQNKKWNCTDLDQVIEITDKLKKRSLNRISIFGHNHNAEVCRVIDDSDIHDPKDHIYANCGTWVDDEYPTFIAVDGDKVQLRDGLDYSIMEEVVLGK